MKHFWEKIRPRRMDEMEQQILFKAQRNGYLSLAAALLVWSLWESVRVYRFNTRLNLLPSLLLGTAALIQGFTQLILTRRAVKDDEDSRETGPLVGIIVLCCAVAGVAATVTASLLLMGARV